MYNYEIAQNSPEIKKLLLLADPNEEMINTYINRSILLTVRHEAQLLGVCVLLLTRPQTFEIMNIAIDTDYQGQGLGTKLLQQAINYIQHDITEKITTIEIATGNSSIKQLYLYQKLGFQIKYIEKDFFSKNYPEPIYENDILCSDLIHLVLNL